MSVLVYTESENGSFKKTAWITFLSKKGNTPIKRALQEIKKSVKSGNYSHIYLIQNIKLKFRYIGRLLESKNSL